MIATIFNEAEDSLTTAQVASELLRRGVTRTTTQVSALLRSAETVGRFIRSDIDGRIHWTNNPEWKAKPFGRKKKGAARPEVAPPREQPAATVVPPARAIPFALTERMSSIAQDLQDALEDACKARLSHDFISHLVAASTSVQNAHRQLIA
ncbi:MAG TPA: hypothetical protein VGF12_09455 [Roseateles sp.]|uniref:hypothetical protein n=1 Tax=Roseateles sp. TaxID=1971397 RepID=UPI002ED9E155